MVAVLLGVSRLGSTDSRYIGLRGTASVSRAGALPPWSRSCTSRAAWMCSQTCCRGWKSSQVQEGPSGQSFTGYLPLPVCDGTSHSPASKVVLHRSAIAGGVRRLLHGAWAAQAGQGVVPEWVAATQAPEPDSLTAAVQRRPDTTKFP
jgi:hypothetical protein